MDRVEAFYALQRATLAGKRFLNSGRHDDGPLSCLPAPATTGSAATPLAGPVAGDNLASATQDAELPRIAPWRFSAGAPLADGKCSPPKRVGSLDQLPFHHRRKARTRRLNHVPPNEKRPQIMLWNTAALMMGQGIGRGTPELFVS